MVAGFLILGLVSALGTWVLALVLGHSVWIAGLAYVLGGMLGLGLGLIWSFLCARIDGLPGLGLYHRHPREQ